jgi:hypothetical protein
VDDRFDIRIGADRRRLAERLPTIDGTTLHAITAKRLDVLLAAFAEWLGNADWLTYQYGAFVLGHPNRPYGSISLATVVELAGRLELLSQFPGFSDMLVGFRNVTQFHATVFETRVAELFAGLPAFHNLRFSPEYQVRGTFKRPDLCVSIAGHAVVVEVKVPRIHAQKAGQKFHRDVTDFCTALNEVPWPADRRLEIEVIAPPREMTLQLARRVVARALAGGIAKFDDGGVRAYIVPKSNPFVTGDEGFVSNTLTADTEATGLFNPHFTKLRIVNSGLFNRIATSVGQTLSDALTQLPPEEECMIMIGDVPTRIAREAIQPRLGDSAYAHVRLFGSWYDTPVEFFFRESERKLLNLLFPGAG